MLGGQVDAFGSSLPSIQKQAFLSLDVVCAAINLHTQTEGVLLAAFQSFAGQIQRRKLENSPMSNVFYYLLGIVLIL